jgi:hypothetical protein
MNGIDLGLLRFCLEHTDAPNLQETKINRDPADYVWLREALSGLETDAQRMKKILDQLKANGEGLKKEELLEELQFLVEDVDNGRDFIKMGGLAYTLQLMRDQSPAVRKWAAWILSSCIQNDPPSQLEAAKIGVWQTLMELLKIEKDEEALLKQVSALSAFIRGNPVVQDVFLQRQIEKDSLLQFFLHHSNPKIRLRGMLVFKHALESPESRIICREKGLILLIVPFLDAEDEDTREKAEEVLLQFTQEKENAEHVKKLVGPQIEKRSHNKEQISPHELDLLKELLQRMK